MTTSTPIKWLHLSDFHVGKDKYETRKIFTYINRHVEAQCQNGFVPDMVFISGDIAQSGLEDQYTQFIYEFLEPLKSILSAYNWPGKLFIVPGNHDLQREFVEDVSRKSRLTPESNFFRANSEGKHSRSIHEIRAFEKFGELILLTDLYPENWLELQEGSFAELFEIKGINIGVAGINTAWLSRDNFDKEQLSPGVDLLELALEKIKNCDLRILLGHHPINWFFPSHRNRIQNILGDHRIVYLHGHLHENRSQPLDTGGGKFLQIQSGAAFQVLEFDETKWKNGFLWAEIDEDLKNIKLQPRYWKSTEGRWGIADDLHEDKRVENDWWSFPLPYNFGDSEKILSVNKKAEEIPINIPDGWAIIDERFVEARSQNDFSEDSFISFFDGAIPSWHKDFISAIPLRNATIEAIKTLQEAIKNDRSTMVFITGAGGEGKSTSLIQVVNILLESNEWNLLLHAQEKAPLRVEDIQNLPTDKPWLLISDDADIIIKDLSKVLPWIAQHHRKIHFLLAARKSDWYSAGGTRVGWNQNCSFREFCLGKLELNEANSIIELWSSFGANGLKSLSGNTQEEATKKLYEASQDEEGKGEGAFLGAMLSVRIAEGLKDHIRILLDRLQKIIIKQSGGKTLMDAFAAIALMHSAGFDFFSSPVVSQYIFDTPDKSPRGSILTPLGKEAAATAAGHSIFTRHKNIAIVARDILERDFGVDPQEIFALLGAASIKAWRNGAYVPELGKWRYDFPKYFLETDQQQTAIMIGKSELESDPDNLLLLTSLAKLYRNSDNSPQAVRLFRANTTINRIRGFYHEWSTTESNAGNHALSVLLDAISLADRPFSVAPDNKQAKLSLAGMGVAFEKLNDQYHEKIFRDAQHACGTLGLCLFLDTTAESYFTRYCESTLEQGSAQMDVDQAFESFIHGVATVWEYTDIKEDLSKQLPSKEEIGFDGLLKLIQRSISRKEESKSKQTK